MKKMSSIAVIAALTALSATAAEASIYTTSYCREYTQTVRVGGVLQPSYGTACMQPDGSWEMVGNPQPVAVSPPVIQQPVVQQVTYLTPQPVYYPSYRAYQPRQVISLNIGHGYRDRGYRNGYHYGHSHRHNHSRHDHR